ncbi:MAG: response regulator [Proteobacteria bacterium]|nr:response regulator [Pseudomonadota bacterium]
MDPIPVILVIDDDRNNLRVASDLLDTAGFAVRAARDGATGIKRAKASPPDLILLDVQMPGIDGFETCRRLVGDPETAEIPVVFMTALTGTEDKVRAFEAGAVDYVSKPFEFAELRARIQTQLNLARLQRQLRASNVLLEERVRERTAALAEANEAMARFVPQEFLASLGHAEVRTTRLGDRIHGDFTVMFSDIRSYTPLAESLGPEQTFALLGDYYQRIGPIVHAHGGYVCQYLGDGFMASFPDPVQAVRSAIAQQQALDTMNAERTAEGQPPIRTGIGLNTGPVTLGIIGDEQRFNTSIVGDTVNLAARMEGLSKFYGVRITISGSTRDALGDRFALRFLERTQARGKVSETSIYEVLDADPSDLRALKLQAEPDFTSGQQAVREGDLPNAVSAFARVLKTLPNDRTTRHWLETAARRLLVSETGGHP